jgi:proteasome alpha subunit
MQFYASPEQVQRDRSEYARKGIARGRSAVVLTYEGGVLLVAENLTSLRKISELYDRIGFAAVGRYNEFESLRRAGVRMADVNGLAFDRRDVTGRALANAYTQTLGAIFSETQKPYEVEICVAQVGTSPESDELYRITYDGSVQDEPGFMAMGGSAEAISTVLKARHDVAADLHRNRKGRTFRRIAGPALTTLLEGGKDVPEKEVGEAGDVAPPAPGEEKPTVSAASANLEGKPEADPAEPADDTNGDGS